MLRHQDIDPRFFTNDCSEYSFISHRWESSTNPDPNGKQFAALQALYSGLQPSSRDSIGFWYDYSCVSQKNVVGERNAIEQKHFENTLKIIHLLAILDNTTILYEPGIFNRTWCC